MPSGHDTAAIVRMEPSNTPVCFQPLGNMYFNWKTGVNQRRIRRENSVNSGGE
jgi:hypothetical protein